MKKLLMKRLFLFMTCILCIACGKTNIPSLSDEAPRAQMAIIKISSEMRDKVFVSPIVDSAVVDYSTINLTTLFYGDGLVLCNPTKTDSLLCAFAESQLGILGTCPYVLLNDGYAIIDWRWAHFHPLSGAGRNALNYSSKIFSNKATIPVYFTNFYYLNGSLANEEYYLLPIGWQEITSLTSIWRFDEGTKIHKPEILYINFIDIEKYGGYFTRSTERKQDNLNNLLFIYDIYSRYDSIESNACAEEFNRWQSAYVETLNKMINNNDLEKWTQIRN